ncbi:ral GTPase-activating protein subunit beta-like isoform X2 [Tigriopus californicus]|uniref:ral GTPase-activating protein subunit beta-like isoform X2 n=1 Tax=Tigriopus californicus TaxID=6832 RepID=UPI0027D9E3FF|nr:ral GTPase-activating protein subunit beta-like isoform X2 [Tigriopus californicus]
MAGKARLAAQETIHKQAVLCHRVLRRIQDVVQQSKNIDRDSWEAVLCFLLAINDALLAPPAIKDDVGDQLCERVLGVLYEIWLVACVKCFPSPPLWKSFREMCLNWRHRTGLVDQWNRVNMALTARLLGFMYGPSMPAMKIPEEDAHLVPREMTNDCVAQAWYRFINSLGNPVDLSRPSIVSQTQHFYQYAIVAENVIDPTHHPCLAALPVIFLKSMKGISAMVDAYLGIFTGLDDSEHAHSCFTYPLEPPTEHLSQQSLALISSPLTPTPPYQRRNLILGLAQTHLHHLRRTPPPLDKTRAASIDIATSSSFDFSSGLPKASHLMGLSRSTSTTGPPSTNTSHISSSSTSIGFSGLYDKPILAAARPKCNSILHLFGKWLFEAAFIGTDYAQGPAQSAQQGQPKSAPPQLAPVPPPKRPQSIHLDPSRRISTSSQQSVGGTSISESLELPAALSPDRFESGQAEAMGALCRIFCSKKTGEEILPVYLARFYLALQQGLAVSPDKVVSEVIAMILVNSNDLLRLDLDGVHVVLPYLITALESVLPERELKLRPTNVSKTELRRAGINILISMLALPSHFQNLPIKELVPGHQGEAIGHTFVSLKPRMVNLLINALQVESEAINTQLLLAGLMFVVQDSSALEMAETKNGQNSQDAERITGGSSGPNSGNFSSLNGAPLSDFSQISEDLNNDCAQAVFVRTTYLVCHRLISSWKTDLNTSLAALEVLGGLARVQLPRQDPLESKRAVKWICDYIVTQCSRPPPAHSKDLHSSIVAAFRCLRTWLLNHPYLLRDKECIATVLEVVEQGVSGSKSKNKASDEPILKEDKILSPASRRVRDAAEMLLTCLLEQVEYFPSKCGAESLSTLLDEVGLFQQCANGDIVSMAEAVQNFRYLVVDNSIIMGILEEPLGNDQEPQPSVTVLLRTASSRNAWTMQLRQLPRHKSGMKSTQINPGRPLPMGDVGSKPHQVPRFFPDSIERIPLCKADRSIPPVEHVVGDEKSQRDTDTLSQLMNQQAQLEEEVVQKSQEENAHSYDFQFECQAPEPCYEFQTARLILSHLGLMNMNTLRQNFDSPLPKLIALESDSINFVTDLEMLDRFSPRTADTVHMFYVKSGQKKVGEILQNVHSNGDVHPYFLELLSSLGWPVNVYNHPGWTGHLSTSWREQTEPMSPPEWQIPGGSGGGGAYDGDHYALYWADASAEIAFLVPTNKPKTSPSPSLITDSGSATGTEGDEDQLSSGKSSLGAPSSLTLQLNAQPIGDPASFKKKSTAFNRQVSMVNQLDVKILVIWLERMEDSHGLPLEEMLAETHTGFEAECGFFSQVKDAFFIFIQPLMSGLLRIKLQGPASKMNIASPLTDGMVVSRRSLGTLIRQTSLNIACRKRLEMDCYQPPHVRRKQKIQEIAQKYRSHMTEPEFYAGLFSPPTV